MDTMIYILLTGNTAFCLIQKQDSEDILILTGEPGQRNRIKDIPRRYGTTSNTRTYDTISVIPFCRIREKGYSAWDENEHIRTILLAAQHEVPAEDLIRAIPNRRPVMRQDIRYDTTEEQYAAIIRKIITDEIGNGEGANFVIPRNSTGIIEDFSLAQALSVFKSLLQHDYGTYWKFLFYDGSLCFIGSTPERHLLVKDSIPEEEVRETHAKGAALISSITGCHPPACEPMLPKIANDDEIAETLAERNQYLSGFWFFRQDHSAVTAENGNKLSITLIDNEDDFIHMLSLIFTAIGLRSTVVPYRDYDMARDRGHITLIGPGPGNPNDTDSAKIRKNLAITEGLLAQKRKSLFICLGHQILCRTLGLAVQRKEAPFQGSQVRINYLGNILTFGRLDFVMYIRRYTDF